MLPGATKKPNSFSTQTHNLNERTLLHLWLSSARTKLHIYTKSVVGLCSSNVYYSFISLVSLDKQIFLCITEIIKVLQKNVLNWHYVNFWPWSTSSLPLLQAMEEFISSRFFLSDYLSSNGTAVHWYFFVKYLYLSNTTNTYNQKHLLFHVAENHKNVWKRNRHSVAKWLVKKIITPVNDRVRFRNNFLPEIAIPHFKKWLPVDALW